MPNLQKVGGHASILLPFICNFAILATQRGGLGTMAPLKYAPGGDYQGFLYLESNPSLLLAKEALSIRLQNTCKKIFKYN